MECVFCKIIKNEIPAKFVYEGERVVAFSSTEPIALIHILIVPKVHIPSFRELESDEIMSEMLRVSQKLIEEKGVGKGYKMIFNGGRYQHINHVHWHLLGGDNLESEVGN